MAPSIVESVIPSFAIALVGYLYASKDRTLDMRSVANLIYYLFSPCLVYSTLAKSSFHPQEFLMLSVSVVILIFSMMLIARIYMKSAGISSNGFSLPVIFMNTGNIALPMALLLYGTEGLSKAIIFHLVNIAFLYSMGVFLVSKKTDLREFFKIPFLYAAILGIVVATADIPVAESIKPYLSQLGAGIDLLGEGAVPLLIISLGYSLKRTRVSDLKHGIAGATMRVVIGPIIAFGLIALYRYLGWAPLEAGYDKVLFTDVRTTEAVIILMGSMPAPIASFLLNEKFNDSPEMSASMVLIGTLAGALTLPLVLTLSRSYVM